MGLQHIAELTQIDYVSGKSVKENFSMLEGLGIAELLLNVSGQIDTSGVAAETVNNPFTIIESIKLTFDGSKTPFEVLGEDLRWLHNLYNGVDVDVLIGGAKQRNYTDTTNDQTVQFLLKLPVFIPANIFTRGTLDVKWSGDVTDLSDNLTIDSFTVFPSLVWDDNIPFMLNFAEEEQTWSGNKEFKPPFSETLRHILVRVTDYSDSLSDIRLKKQRTTIIESRYEELLAQMSDLENLSPWPVLGDNATLRYGLLNITTPARIVSDDTTILKLKTTASKTVHVLWINAIPIAAKKQPDAKVDLLKFLKI